MNFLWTALTLLGGMIWTDLVMRYDLKHLNGKQSHRLKQQNELVELPEERKQPGADE